MVPTRKEVQFLSIFRNRPTDNRTGIRFQAIAVGHKSGQRQELNQRGPDLHLLRPTRRSWPQRLDRGSDGGPQLTQHELAVLLLVANGHRTREMAPMISVTPATVRKHVQNFFEKLDIHCRLGAVSASLEKGIL